MPKTPLSVKQVVEATGIPKRTVILEITRGRLKASKLPGLTGSYLISQTDLDRWLAQREAAAS